MALKDTDMIRKIHRLRDEIKNTSVAIGRRAFLELPPPTLSCSLFCAVQPKH